MRSGVLDGLPEAVRALARSRGCREPASEPRADCARCPMVGDAPLDPGPGQFRRDVRCCGFHPQLANFLVGAALRDDTVDAQRLTARIAQRKGVSPWGIYPPPGTHDRYARSGGDRFGRQRADRCPYASDGEHLCTIWSHRPGVCRTWFCKHDAGVAGAHRWSEVEQIVWDLENRLAFLLVELGAPDTFAAAPPDQWTDDELSAWFIWCADRARALSPTELARLEPGPPSERRAPRAAATAPPMPELLVPAVTEALDTGEGLIIIGYSRYDGVVVPRSVYRFLAALDGVTGWTQAARDAGLDEHTVRELYRVGALAAATRDS